MSKKLLILGAVVLLLISGIFINQVQAQVGPGYEDPGPVGPNDPCPSPWVPMCGLASSKMFVEQKTAPLPNELCTKGSATNLRYNNVFTDQSSECYPEMKTNGNYSWNCNGGACSLLDYVPCQSKPYQANCCTRNIVLKVGEKLPNTLKYKLCQYGEAISDLKQNSDGSYEWCCLANDNQTKYCGCHADMVGAIVNGQCGSANGQEYYEKPTASLCARGTASDVVEQTNIFAWNCLGKNGGKDVSCSATKLVKDPDPDPDPVVLVNEKDLSKYAFGEAVKRPIFIVSANNWWEVMSLVPLTTWTDDKGTLKKYPSFIYLMDGAVNDLDSIIHTAQMYQADQAIVVGDTVADNQTSVTELLKTPRGLGAGIAQENIASLNYKKDPGLYFSFWKNYNEVVYVDNNYQFAQLAATYASLINAPLVVNATTLDNDKYFIDKKIICFGGSLKRNCDVRYSGLAQMQDAYIAKVEQLTGAKPNKMIITNTADLKFSVDLTAGEGTYIEAKKTGNLYHIFGKDSLSAPYLASAKYEVIMPFNEVIGSSDCNFSKFDCIKVRDQVSVVADKLSLPIVKTNKQDYDEQLYAYMGYLKVFMDGKEKIIDKLTNSAISLDYEAKIIYLSDGSLKSYDFNKNGEIKVLATKMPVVELFAAYMHDVYWYLENKITIFDIDTKVSQILTFPTWIYKTVFNKGNVLAYGLNDSKQYVIYYYPKDANTYSKIYTSAVDARIGDIYLTDKYIVWRQASGNDADIILFIWNIATGKYETQVIKNVKLMEANNDYLVWTVYGSQFDLFYLNFTTKEIKNVIYKSSPYDEIIDIWFDGARIYAKTSVGTTYKNFWELDTGTRTLKKVFGDDNNYMNCGALKQKFLFKGYDIYFFCSGSVGPDKKDGTKQSIYKYINNPYALNGPPSVYVDSPTLIKRSTGIIFNNLYWIEDKPLIYSDSASGYLTVIGDAYSVPYINSFDYESENSYSSKGEPSSADKTIYANLDGPIFWSKSMPELAVGRLTGLSISDTSSLVARSIFYDDFDYQANTAMYSARDQSSSAGCEWQKKACDAFVTSGYKLNDCLMETERTNYDLKFYDCANKCLCDNDEAYRQDYDLGKTKCSDLKCTTAGQYCDQELKTLITSSEFKINNPARLDQFRAIALKMYEKESKNWTKASFISYIDHGADNFAGIYEDKVPELDNSFVSTLANDTAKINVNYTTVKSGTGVDAEAVKRRSIALTSLRNGAIAFMGAMKEIKNSKNGVYFFPTVGMSMADNIYYSGKNLGDSLLSSMSSDDAFVLLGDPTLVVGKKKLVQPIN